VAAALHVSEAAVATGVAGALAAKTAEPGFQATGEIAVRAILASLPHPQQWPDRLGQKTQANSENAPEDIAATVTWYAT